MAEAATQYGVEVWQSEWSMLGDNYSSFALHIRKEKKMSGESCTADRFSEFLLSAGVLVNFIVLNFRENQLLLEQGFRFSNLLFQLITLFFQLTNLRSSLSSKRTNAKANTRYDYKTVISLYLQDARAGRLK